MKHNWFKPLLVTVAFCWVTSLHAQDYCDYPYAFLAPSQPESIDTFVVHVDTVDNFYGDEFYVKLKFAHPVKDKLPFTRRPLIIAVHGGGFVSDSLGSSQSTLAYQAFFNQMYGTFAPLGFATASLDYRTGFGKEEELALSLAVAYPGSAYCDHLTPHIQQRVQEAAIRATADCRKAIDYIVQNADQFPFIDTSQIYLYGGSAGAMTVLHTAFSDYEEFFPSGNPDFKPFAPRHKVAGVVAASGALTDYDGGQPEHMDAKDQTPVFMAHGLDDKIVLPGRGPLANCSNVADQYHWNGSNVIAENACKLGIPFELFQIEKAGHTLGGGYPVGGKLGLHMVSFMINHGICPKPTPSIRRLFDLQGDLLNETECDYDGIFGPDPARFTVYPNPFVNQITVAGDLAGTEQLVLRDARGREVMAIARIGSARTFEVSDLSGGVYFLEVMGEKGRYVIRLVK